MYKATLRQLRAQRMRLVGVGLAIMIGTGFTTTTLLFGDIIDQGFRNSVGAEYRNIDFVLDADGAPFTPQFVGRVEALDGVADVQPGSTFWIDGHAGGRRETLIVLAAPGAGDLRRALELDSGRLPEASGEITLLRSAARSLRVEVGDAVTLTVPGGDIPAAEPVARDFTLVGLWSGDGRFGADDVTGFLAPEDMARWPEQVSTSTLYVVSDGGVGPATVERALHGLGDGRVTVTTGEQWIDQEMREFGSETAIQKIGVGAFGAIALVVAGIVVSNTFAILVAQRTREIALFRCAGATTRQVRRMVMAEAVTVGLAASVAGVSGAVVLTNVVLRVIAWQFDMDNIPAGIGVPMLAVVIPVLAGIAVAIGAAWGPARTAAGIDPLQALRIAHLPVDPRQRTGPVRTGLALLSLIAGASLLTGGVAISSAGSREAGILAGFAGGLATWLGVMLGAAVLVPAAVALFSRIANRLGGVPTRIAASNSVRNPRRTTATTIALVIGVALVTMMSVGAESLKATMFGEIDVQTPWDLEITNAGSRQDDGEFDSFAESVGPVDGVAAQAVPGRLEATIPGQRSGESIVFDARAVDPDELAAVWRDDAVIARFEPGVALIPVWLVESTGIRDGETFAMEIGGARREYRAVETTGTESVLVTPDAVAGLVEPVVDSFWLRLDDGADADAVLDLVYAQADTHGITIDAGDTSGYRQTLTSALDALLLVITALLGVAVLIAVIGVGNTLSLSVIERTRESALLRALGFTKRQLRQSLAIEGILLSSVGCLIGVMLGTVFGWIGTMTVVGNAWPIALAFPWGRIGLIVVVAIACGLLASILPARRAVRAEPMVALADV